MSERIFLRGDHAELADALIEILTRNGAKQKLPGAPLYREIDGKTQFVSEPEMSRIIQSFAGSKIVGSSHPLRIQHGTVRAVIKLARVR